MATYNRNDNKLSTNYMQTKPKWHIKTVFENLDFFAEPIPAFNLTG